MHTRREQGIDKTGGIANENIAITDDMVRRVRPILDDKGASSQRGLLQQPRRVGGLRQLLAEKALRATALQPLLACTAVHHSADTHPASVQRNIPQPAVGIGFDKDICVIGRWQALRPGKIAIDGEVLKEGIPAAHLQFAPQQSALATGVDHEARLDDAFRSALA